MTGTELAARRWWEWHDRLVEVADWAVDNSTFTTPAEVVAFFEKPWKYEELHDEWYRETQ